MRAVAYPTVVVFCGFAHAAPVPTHLMREPTDLDRLQGSWQHESTVVTLPGVKRTTKKQSEIVLEVRGSRIKQHTATDVTHANLNLTTVEGVKRFGLTDVTRTNRDGERIAANKAAVLEFGYTIEGDKLTLALDATPGQSNPIDPTKLGECHLVMVFTRVKDKK